MTIVQMSAVPNFDVLPPNQAEQVLYEQLVPACEAQGIKLSGYGNHATQQSLSSVAEYNKEKAEHKLFNVARIQKAFSQVHHMVVDRSQYKTDSYGFKHVVEKSQGEYITNGDAIAAMLLHGYEARFGKRGQPVGVNCEFKVAVTVKV